MDVFGDDTALYAGVLDVSTVHTESYGHGYDGHTSDGIVEFEFHGGGRGMLLEFDAYDIDKAGELNIFVNDQWIGSVQAGADGEMSEGFVAISADHVHDGTNTLTFVHMDYHLDYADYADETWGISNILLTPEPTLFFGEFEDGVYGHKFQGTSDLDGTVSFQFFFEPTDDMTLFVQGFDIDFEGEIEVFLNGVSMGFMSVTGNNEMGGSQFDIALEDVADGGNVISFEVAADTKRHWGVTDLVLLNSDINVSTMKIDPEFTDNGWVTWQEADKIYLGKYDTNSGALMEVVNESVGGALPFYVTYYGSELLETSNGVVALGITDHGIIYLDEHDSYIIPGTEGFRVGFLPKGVSDGLRFTMVPLDYWVYDGGPAEVYLYDNGDISLIDFGDETTRAITWLNESEVLSFSSTQMGIYNVDTGEMEWLAADTYDEGYSAALEMKNGDKYFTVLSDDGYTDIWRNLGSGWELYHRLTTPDEIFGQYMYSPELQEHDGKLYLMAISSELPTTVDLTSVVLYNVMDDTWSQVGDVGYWFDPEIFVLDWGFSLYYRNQDDGTTEWFNVSFEDVLAAEVPGIEAAITSSEADQEIASDTLYSGADLVLAALTSVLAAAGSSATPETISPVRAPLRDEDTAGSVSEVTRFTDEILFIDSHADEEDQVVEPSRLFGLGAKVPGARLASL